MGNMIEISYYYYWNHSYSKRTLTRIVSRLNEIFIFAYHPQHKVEVCWTQLYKNCQGTKLVVSQGSILGKYQSVSFCTESSHL